MHCRPAVEPISHICRNTLFPSNGDDIRNEAVIAVAMDRWRKANHRRTYALRHHRSRCLFRSYAGNPGGHRWWCILFGREQTCCEGDPGAGGDDQGASRANECGAEGLDGVPIRLTARLPPREVVDEGGMDHAIR